MEDELNQLLRALSQRDSGVEGDASTLLGLQEAKKQGKNILQHPQTPQPVQHKGHHRMSSALSPQADKLCLQELRKPHLEVDIWFALVQPDSHRLQFFLQQGPAETQYLRG